MDDDRAMTIYDSKGRILVVQKRLKGRFFFIFLRYPDMLEPDKKASRTVFETIMLNDSNAASPAGAPIGDIDGFLDFKDDGPDLCG